MLAGPSPEVLIGPIAAATTNLRVGSGGVMLPHYSPLKVAETFSILAGLFPGRIDLGIGRAAGHRSDDDVRAAARPPPGRARRLPRAARRAARATSRTACPPTIPSPGSPQLPGLPEAPEPWLLGSSTQSAIWAARAGPAVRVRRLHQPARRRRAPSCTGELRAVAPRSTRRAGGRGVGARGRLRRGGRAAGDERRMTFTLLRRGPAHPGAAGRQGAAVPGRGGAARPAAAERRAILGTGGERPRPARGGRARVRRRGGRRRDDHPRPRGPAPLLRAARRGLRPARRELRARAAA